MAGFSANILYATNGDFTNATAVKGSLANGLITNGQLWIGSTIANAGGTHINVGNIVSAGNSIAVSYASPNINLEAGATIATIYTENTGTATPAANNLNIFGLGETTTIGLGSTVSIFSPRVAKFVVDPIVNNGTNQTIQSAINAASSGQTIFIRPGTYTENLFLKPGVSLTAFTCDGSSIGSSIPNVLIIGKMTLNVSGVCLISGMAFQTNGDYIIETSNANAKPVFTNCFFNCTNASGMHAITGFIECNGCKGNLNTNGITWFIVESGGQGVLYRNCYFDNTLSTTASTNAGSVSIFEYSVFSQPITTSNAGSINCFYSRFIPANNTCITLAGTGILNAERCLFSSGTASAISVGAGCTANVNACNISSSNANAISGAGTFNYNNLNFTSTGFNLAATTNTLGISTCFQKVVQQVFTSASSTYTPTTGMKYCIVQCLAGGGAGGGAQVTGASTVSVGAGGGAGEYAEGVFTAAQVGASQTATVGAGGTGVSGASGNPGNTSSLGALITCGGGNGGGSGGAGTTSFANEGAGGSGGTGGSFHATGMRGMYGYVSTTLLAGPQGANSQLGAGGASSLGGSFAGSNASNYGAGGGGAINSTSQGTRAGGNGSQGIIIITEFV